MVWQRQKSIQMIPQFPMLSTLTAPDMATPTADTGGDGAFAEMFTSAADATLPEDFVPEGIVDPALLLVPAVGIALVVPTDQGAVMDAADSGGASVVPPATAGAAELPIVADEGLTDWKTAIIPQPLADAPEARTTAIIPPALPVGNMAASVPPPATDAAASLRQDTALAAILAPANAVVTQLRPPATALQDRPGPGAPSRQSATLIRAEAEATTTDALLTPAPPVAEAALPDSIAAPSALLQTAPNTPLSHLPAASPQSVAPENLATLLTDYATTPDSGPVEVVLNPQELGKLRFEIQQNGDQVKVILTVERPETLDLMRRHGEQLLSDLRQSGFQDATLSFGQWGAQDHPDQTAQLPPDDLSAPAATPAFAPAPLWPARTDLGGQGLNLRL